MDEAMNDLTLVTVGMYGDILQNPNGPPIRIIIRGNTASRASSR